MLLLLLLGASLALPPADLYGHAFPGRPLISLFSRYGLYYYRPSRRVPARPMIAIGSHHLAGIRL